MYGLLSAQSSWLSMAGMDVQTLSWRGGECARFCSSPTAERWLHEQTQKEGWSKASKLEGRRAKEGLISLFVGDKAAVMEVNCETDCCPLLAAEDLSKLNLGEGASLADRLALTIGPLGENMSVRVAVGVPAGWHIGSYIHSGVAGQSDMAMGRYGALMVFQGGQGQGAGHPGEEARVVCSGRGPHIPGQHGLPALWGHACCPNPSSLTPVGQWPST
ncbi:hypothetical protein J4Q44_G00083540 [Coregonus suidteri]|uniref:Uncharacterized protein n=1 Tax=Coregonus suidteri TaxID=861788 RepID=A0AAN8R313_9TELE